MGLLTSLFSVGSRSDFNRAFLSGDDLDVFSGSTSSSGVRVSRETALTYSAIWKGVSLISGDVGRLPTYVDRLEGKGRQRAKEHTAYNLLRRKPNDYMTAMQFKQTLQGHALCEGNGYAYIWRDGAGRPTELTILNPQQVTPVRYNGVLWYVYKFASGEDRKLPFTDVLHIRGFSFDGLIGYNLIHKARESIGWALAMQTYGSVFFKNNATPRVILEAPNKLGKDTGEKLRASWERIYAGLENAHRTAVLEEGLKANVLGTNAKDAQLVDQMKFTFIDVANWLKLPPHKVGGDGRTAFASLAQENQAYLDDCLDGWLVAWEEECRDKLLTEAEKDADSHEVRFDRKQLLRANLPERTSFYQAMVNLGILSLDEVREEEGENPQPNGIGKVYQRPLNVAYIDENGKIVPMQPEAPEQPAESPPDVGVDDLESSLFDIDEEEPTDDQRATKEKADAERAAVMRSALSAILKDATRRMAKRIGLQAERAAGDGKKYMAWLDTFEAETRETVREAFGPVARALSAMGVVANPAKWLLSRMRWEFSALADKATPAALPGAAAALAVELVEKLPRRAAARYVERRGFCPTGKGGGVDPTCGGGAGAGGGSSGKLGKINAEPTTKKAISLMFGDKATTETVARAAGASDGAQVSISHLSGAELFVTITHEDYTATREVYTDHIHNSTFFAKETGTGLGTKVFGEQVDAAVELGMKYIKCDAVRDTHSNGYYTWARLGYDGRITAPDDSVLGHKLSEGPNGEKYVSELMKTKEGRDWWKQNGTTFQATFDLTEGSLSRRTLDAYRQEKAKRGKKS